MSSHGKNSIVERTIFWFSELESIVIRPMLPDSPQNCTSIGVATTLIKNPGHSDIIYVVESVLNYFLWLNSSNG